MGRLLFSLVGIAFGPAACGTPTPYAPAERDGGYGYAVQRLEDNRFRVSFSGNSLTDRRTVENYLLYRAAGLTLEQGGDYFIVVNRAVDADTAYHTTYDSPPYFGHRPWYRRYGDPLWDEGTTRSITRYVAYAEIVVRSGGKTPGDTAAFDAREVVRNLGPTIVKPPPAQ